MVWLILKTAIFAIATASAYIEVKKALSGAPLKAKAEKAK